MSARADTVEWQRMQPTQTRHHRRLRHPITVGTSNGGSNNAILAQDASGKLKSDRYRENGTVVTSAGGVPSISSTLPADCTGQHHSHRHRNQRGRGRNRSQRHLYRRRYRHAWRRLRSPAPPPYPRQRMAPIHASGQSDCGCKTAWWGRSTGCLRPAYCVGVQRQVLAACVGIGAIRCRGTVGCRERRRRQACDSWRRYRVALTAVPCTSRWLRCRWL